MPVARSVAALLILGPLAVMAKGGAAAGGGAVVGGYAGGYAGGSGSGSGSSSGAWIGIVIGAVVGALALVGAVSYCYCYHHKKQANRRPSKTPLEMSSTSGPAYPTSQSEWPPQQPPGRSEVCARVGGVGLWGCEG